MKYVVQYQHPASTKIYTLSLHDALPISRVYDLFPSLAERRRNRGNHLSGGEQQMLAIGRALMGNPTLLLMEDRKSTRLNSSHVSISYAVFCLKKKKKYVQTCTVTIFNYE